MINKIKALYKLVSGFLTGWKLYLLIASLLGGYYLSVQGRIKLKDMKILNLKKDIDKLQKKNKTIKLEYNQCVINNKMNNIEYKRVIDINKEWSKRFNEQKEGNKIAIEKLKKLNNDKKLKIQKILKSNEKKTNCDSTYVDDDFDKFLRGKKARN